MIVVGLCAAIGPLALYAIPGLLVLVGFIAALGLVVVGLAALAMDVIAGMPKLGSDLAAFMTNVQPFISGVRNIPDDISDKVGKLTSAILKLTSAKILDAITSFFSGGNSIANLGNELKAFGDGIASFTASSANIDAAVASMSKLKDLQSALAGIDLSQLSVIASELENYSIKINNLNAAAIRSAFTSQNGTFVSVGKNLISAFIKGLNSKKAEVNSTALSIVSSASGKLRSGYSEFYNAGVYLGGGLISGLNSKTADVAAKAAAMTKTAIDAINETADINSPSKETEQTGKYMGQGLVNGLDSFADAASDSGFNLGDSVKSGLSEALSGIQDSMDLEFDDQITITPVLDMDKAKAKATEFKDWLTGGTNTINGNLSSNAMSKIDKLQAIVDKIWRGEYGNGEDRKAKLISEGYDYKLIQDLVNKTTDGRKLTIEDLPSELRDSLNSMNTTATSVAAISTAVHEKAVNNSKIEGLISSGFNNLSKDLSKIEKPSYVINGITYDDGSAISDTVKALIRGAMVERRV